MNILFISHYSSLYGANHSLIDLIDGLKVYDITSYVIIPTKGEIENDLSKREIQYKVLSVPVWVSRESSSILNKIRLLRRIFKISKEYKKCIKEWGIDIIYTNSSVSPIGRLLASQTGKPHIWHIREFLDLHYSYQYIFPKGLSEKYILTSNAIICNSFALKVHHFANYNNKIDVIYNGIATEDRFNAFRQDRYKFRDSGRFIFSIVGKIYPMKGQEVAIKAIDELRKRGLFVGLIIAGNGGEHLKDCQELVNQLNLDPLVEFTGYINNPYQVYQRSSCLLVCSEYEAMGRSTVEGMSACLPVIARNSGGSSEIVSHGKTGYLYDNFHELVDYMEKLVKNPALAQKMGYQGWDLAKEKYTIENYSRSIYKVINSL